MSTSEASVSKVKDCSESPPTLKRNLKRKRSEEDNGQVASKLVHLEDSKCTNFVINIPDEIILKIFKYLKGNDLFNLSRLVFFNNFKITFFLQDRLDLSVELTIHHHQIPFECPIAFP